MQRTVREAANKEHVQKIVEEFDKQIDQIGPY